VLKRVLFFVYGVASYLIFLVTFLYAIAFVGGIVVPSRLDGPLQTSLFEALTIDCALLTLFAVQHSVMARPWFKQRWTQVVPWTIERSTYVLCASLALLLLFWQWRPIGIVIWSVENAPARVVLWTLFGAGWATVLGVTFLINHFDLFGLRQVWLPLIGRPYSPVSFRTPLPYRFVRHPLYLGFLLAFWMAPTMTLAHFVFAFATTAYIVVAIQFEERELVSEHGAEYEEYRRTVPMLLPGRRRLPAPAAPVTSGSRVRRPHAGQISSPSRTTDQHAQTWWRADSADVMKTALSHRSRLGGSMNDRRSTRHYWYSFDWRPRADGPISRACTGASYPRAGIATSWTRSGPEGVSERPCARGSRINQALS